jgi:hypothetical protein
LFGCCGRRCVPPTWPLVPGLTAVVMDSVHAQTTYAVVGTAIACFAKTATNNAGSSILSRGTSRGL